MTWVLLVGLLWAALALPAALLVGMTFRMADPDRTPVLGMDGSWTDEVSEFLKAAAAPQVGPGSTA